MEPRLLLFAACEKTILASDGSLSLITVLEKIVTEVPTEIELPDKPLSPMRWSVVTMWERDPSDTDAYEQRSRVLSPNGEQIFESDGTGLDFGGKRLARVIGNLHQAPIANGMHSIELFLRRVGDQDWQSIAKYPIEFAIKYQGSQPT